MICKHFSAKPHLGGILVTTLRPYVPTFRGRLCPELGTIQSWNIVFAKENTVVSEDVQGLALENAKFRK